MSKYIIAFLIIVLAQTRIIKAQGDPYYEPNLIAPQQFFKSTVNAIFINLSDKNGEMPFGKDFSVQCMLNYTSVIDTTFMNLAQNQNAGKLIGFIILPVRDELINVTTDSVNFGCRITYDGDEDTTNNSAFLNYPLETPPSSLNYSLVDQKIYIRGQVAGDTISSFDDVDSITCKVTSNINTIFPSVYYGNRIAVRVNGQKQFHSDNLNRWSPSFLPPFTYTYRLQKQDNGLLNQVQMPSSPGWVELCLELDEPADADPSNNSECGQPQTRFYLKNPSLSVAPTNALNQITVSSQNGWVRIDNTHQVPLTVSIFNLQGKLITKNSGTQPMNLDLDAGSGIYLIHLQNKHQVLVKKIFLE